jgi:hypothetical protein
MKHYNALARSMIQGRNGSLDSGRFGNEADEYIHHLPAGDVGGASGEEHQQLLLAVHLVADRPTGHVLSPLDSCSTVRWRGGTGQILTKLET